MGSFDSPIGGKKFTNLSLREFDVPNEDDPNLQQIMRKKGPSLHGTQPPVDIGAAVSFQQKMQEEDDDAQMADIERQMKEAREAKRAGKVRLTDGAKRRIEMLVGMTRGTRQVDIDGNKYIFQTLLGKETKEVVMAVSEFAGTVQTPFEVRRQYLARSLVHIAGLDIDQFVGSNNLEDKLELIDSLPEELLNRLYDEYLILQKESKEKYAIKNESEIKEVIEDLKK